MINEVWLKMVCCSCLAICETCLPFNELTTKGDKVNKDSPGYIIYSCLLAALRVLVNITHDNGQTVASSSHTYLI